jgi:alginate O-acetyltransferase complex protein AlgI
MLFPTIEFAVFFLLVGTLYWALGATHGSGGATTQNNRQKLFLLAASYFFYGFWNWRYVALIFASTVIDYIAGAVIYRARENQPKRARTWLLGSLIANLALLGFFKYYNFFQLNLVDAANLVGMQSLLPALEIILPVGISFYTFQSMAYTIDIYTGRVKPTENFADFMLFVAFFPQLVAGPICRAGELLPQIRDPRKTIPDMHEPVTLVASGLAKKMVLATFITTRLVDDAFIAPSNYSSLELWVAAWGYTAVVYLDFSGYTDLARGTSMLLGYRLPENFNAPYAATNIGEFWRRWHMTFSRWLRQYIYYPMGGSKAGAARTYFNLAATFLIGGLWHGAHWKFVIWGAIHGTVLVLYKASLDLRRGLGIDPKGRKPLWLDVGGWMITMHVVVVARIFFRSPDLPTAGRFLQGLSKLTWAGRGMETAVLVAIVFSIGLHFYGRLIREATQKTLASTPRALLPLVWLVMMMALIKVKPQGVAPYIYFQF